MLLVGEKFNSSIPKTMEMYKSKNEEEIINLIKSQKEADYIDINTSLCDNELDMMKYMIELCESNSKAKIMIDSSNPDILCKAAKFVKGEFLLNSVTVKDRINEVIPIMKEYNCPVAALPMVEEVPKTAKERLENAEIIIDTFTKEGISIDKVYFDILIEPVSTDSNKGKVILETLDLFKERGLFTICGLSNISYGLPNRKQINSTYLSLLMSRGLDSAICDVCDENLVKNVKICDALLGNDEYCMKYIKYCRKNRS